MKTLVYLETGTYPDFNYIIFYLVYTISNPIGSSKAKAYLHKWNSQSYTVEKFVTRYNFYTSTFRIFL